MKMAKRGIHSFNCEHSGSSGMSGKWYAEINSYLYGGLSGGKKVSLPSILDILAHANSRFGIFHTSVFQLHLPLIPLK